MGSPLIDDFLTGDSKAIRDLANNEAILVGFLTLVKEIDDMPDMEPRFYETSRSLYQVTALRTSDETLLASLGAFFGKPQKAAGKSLPVGLRFDPVVKHLGGARKDQTLFFKKLKTGAFYGALWPWQMDPQKVEVHLGFFSSSISDVDYQRLEGLLKKMLSRQKIETVSGGVGGEIHGISLPSFLQMSEMEEATYTLRVASGSRVGYLYIDGGRLIAARYDELTGNEAAYRIISWDKASIQIEPAEPERVREIREPLMHVMMESLKIKDEPARRKRRRRPFWQSNLRRERPPGPAGLQTKENRHPLSCRPNLRPRHPLSHRRHPPLLPHGRTQRRRLSLSISRWTTPSVNKGGWDEGPGCCCSWASSPCWWGRSALVSLGSCGIRPTVAMINWWRTWRYPRSWMPRLSA
ncbi:DUF4388 domain-containing protein [Desulfosarcina cetonica]|uniref:DUF4388 domain-containing protein n=1 Tax=Desulfosarcina cetonica TaxID=90730 RepID=UPI0006CF50EC|nr:DUF4388 domain-containing protein [Desulfosarcina cetonica]